MEAVYNFLQKCILFLRASAARDTLKEEVSRLDELLQRAKRHYYSHLVAARGRGSR